MESQLVEWLNLVLRGSHVVVALAWIGASFYLISWENKFNRISNLREGVEGDFWTIQGGDFYYVEKLKGAPAKLPDALHWFKYEAYFTWLSGFALMCMYFYANASLMMLHPASPLQSSTQAVIASILSLAGVWILYALYSRTRAARNLRLSAVIGIFAVAALAFFYSTLFSGRAAFIHVGAAMGTIMSANVFFSIIPWHKRLLRAISNGQVTDELYRAHPGFRSRHNHYMTLPVILLMLSSHAPVSYATELSWLIATLLVAAAGFAKHFHTCLQQKKSSLIHLVIGLSLFVAAVAVTRIVTPVVAGCDRAVSYSEVRLIVEKRCSDCHSHAGDMVTPATPQNVVLDTAARLRQWREQLTNRVVIEKTMPPANATGMLEREREILNCWLQQPAENQ